MPYYLHTPNLPQASTRGDAAQIRNEFDLVQAGFDALPDAQRLFTNSAGFVADTGGVNAFYLAAVPAVDSYLDGMEVLFKVASDVTGACTINVNGLGLKTVNRTDGTPIQAGDIFQNQIVSMRYSAATDTFQFFSSTAGAAAGAAAASAASASQSAGYRDQSQSYSLESKGFRDTASSHKDAAATSASGAAGSASSALTYKNDAQTFRNQAEVFKNQAEAASSGPINDAATGAATTWSSNKLVATFSQPGHTHNAAAITDFAAAVALLAQPLLADVIVSGTSATLAAGQRLILVNAAATTVTLPASPADRAYGQILVANGRTDNVLLSNGKTVNGDATGSHPIDFLNAPLGVYYVNSTYQWRLVS